MIIKVVVLSKVIKDNLITSNSYQSLGNRFVPYKQACFYFSHGQSISEQLRVGSTTAILHCCQLPRWIYICKYTVVDSSSTFLLIYCNRLIIIDINRIKYCSNLLFCWFVIFSKQLFLIGMIEYLRVWLLKLELFIK